MWKVKQRLRYATIEEDSEHPRLRRGTFHIGPRHVKHHASNEFVEHTYVENPDFASEKNCRVFAQSSNIAIEVYDFYNKLFDPDYENVSVYDERFEVQYLFKEPDTWRSADYYNPRIEVILIEDGVNIRKIFDTDYGPETLEITYTIRTGVCLKHTIVFTNKTAKQRTFRVVMKLTGITSDKVKHGRTEKRITEEKYIVAPVIIFGEDNQHLKLSEYLWSLGETNEETDEWSPTTLKNIILDVHAQGCKANIIIGNYVLAQSENLLIDPDSDTWQVGASARDCLRRKPLGDYWSTTHTSCAAGYHISTKYSFGSGMRFINVGIPKGDIISSAYLQFTADDNRAVTPVNTRISGEDGIDYFQTVSDVVGLLESVPTPVGAFKQSTTDILGLLESAPSAASLHAVASDHLGLLDVVTPRADFKQGVADQLGMLDTTTTVKTLFQTITDLIGMSDVVVRRADFKEAVSELLGMADSAVAPGTLHKTVTDQLGMLDIAAPRIGYIQVITDQLGMLDIAAPRIGYRQVISDYLGLLDIGELRTAHGTPIILEVMDDSVSLEIPDTERDLEVPDTAEDLEVPDTEKDLEIPDTSVTQPVEKVKK